MKRQALKMILILSTVSPALAAADLNNEEDRKDADALIDSVWSRDTTADYCMENPDATYWTAVETEAGVLRIPVDCPVWFRWNMKREGSARE